MNKSPISGPPARHKTSLNNNGIPNVTPVLVGCLIAVIAVYVVIWTWPAAPIALLATMIYFLAKWSF